MVTIFSIDDLKVVEDLSKLIPNDFDLGKRIRSLYGDSDLCKSFPNDTDLGSQVRKMFK